MAKRNPRFEDLIGQVFHHLTVLKEDGKTPGNRCTLWLVRCVCGKEKHLTNSGLKHAWSCGCRRKESIGKVNAKHRLTGSIEYLTWTRMRNRCSNSSHQDYENYGGRGITVCERWNSFENFLEDMGKRPSRLYSLDRYPDVNGPYCPDNCRWATQKEQQNNKRNNIQWTYNNITLSPDGWAKILGIKRNTLFKRIESGWSIERTLSSPLGKHHFHEKTSSVIPQG